jgi:hypothetical protein
MIAHYPFAEVNGAVADVAEGRVIKPVFVMDEHRESK